MDNNIEEKFSIRTVLRNWLKNVDLNKNVELNVFPITDKIKKGLAKRKERIERMVGQGIVEEIVPNTSKGRREIKWIRRR